MRYSQSELQVVSNYYRSVVKTLLLFMCWKMGKLLTIWLECHHLIITSYIPTYMQTYHIISFWVKLHYVARWKKLPKKIDEEKETSLNLIFTNNTYAFPCFSFPWNHRCFYHVQLLLHKTDLFFQLLISLFVMISSIWTSDNYSFFHFLLTLLLFHHSDFSV